MSIAKVNSGRVTATTGTPELIIDGQNVPPVWYALSGFPAVAPSAPTAQEGIANFAARGVNVVCLFSRLADGWKENGDYDPENLFTDIRAVLKVNPNAKIVTRMNISAPYWWLRKYPEEQIKYLRKQEKDGKTEYVELANSDNGDRLEEFVGKALPENEMKASMASEKFLHDSGEILKKLCKKVKAHPLGEHLIGIQVAYGTCGEWHYWGTYDGLYEADYSEPMQRLFRKIVREKYKDEAELQRFYGAGAKFETVEMATSAQRAIYHDWSTPFLEPEKHARVIDTWRVFSYASAWAISYLCACIKEQDRDMLTGAFYAYFFYTAGAITAHFEPQLLFADKNVDFLAGPCAYTHNKFSGNMNMIRHVAESCRLNGKLFLCEMDQGYASWDTERKIAYSCENEQEYASIMIRNVMENILLGNGLWYFEHKLPPDDPYHKEGYWTTPERLATIARLQKTCENLLEKEYKKTTDVLVVVDEQSKYHAGFDPIDFSVIDAIGKSGAGFDRLYLTDIEKCDISRYKCVILSGCIVMNKRIYDYIVNTVMSDGRTVVFVKGFAWVVDKTTDFQRLTAITGVPYGEEYTEFATESCEVVYMPKISKDKEYYHELFQRAGAHIYTYDGEVVIADNEMVMVHCKDIPHTTLHLPCGDIEIDNPKYSTVVYNTLTGERIV